jgi:hypothetical protein
MVQEHGGNYHALCAAVESIVIKIGCVSQALLERTKREKTDTGFRDGLTTSVARTAQGPGVLEDTLGQVSGYVRGRADLQGFAVRPSRILPPRGTFTEYACCDQTITL